MTNRTAVETFILEEAQIMDEHRYDDWEALWTDDGNYWVPANGEGDSPANVSIINDNRERIHSRIDRFKSGVAHSQDPKSRLVRLITNIRIAEESADEVTVWSHFMVAEARPNRETTWIGKTMHRLVESNGSLKIKQKKVILVNNSNVLPTLGFLL